MQPKLHPTGAIVASPGNTFQYEIIGPCCRLYDREQLPWPSCSLDFGGKQPSWRRIGQRLIADMGAKHAPSYSVKLVGTHEMFIHTFYHDRFSPEMKKWWHTPRNKQMIDAIEKKC